MADIFPPTAIPRLPIVGSADTYPVNRIFCVGRNYAAHAAEMGAEVERSAPFFFLKGHHAVIPSGGAIPYPPGTSDYHHEFELVVALGSGGFEVPEDRADSLIFGYACGLDMTRRDLQQANRKKGLPWDTGKNVEASCVLTSLTPRARFLPGTQRISLRKNDAVVQDAVLSDMIWSIPELLSHLSRLYHLQPGDLLMTGTPAGVGPVRPGDALIGEIPGLEALHATFV